MKNEFLLNPNITFLNHGSFGAVPKFIMEEWHKIQYLQEEDSVNFIQVLVPKMLKSAREALGKFVGCNGSDLFFTYNPTYAVNTIMRSLKLNAGDEILTTNHEYGAMDRTWNFYCKKSGVNYIRQAITLPVTSKEQILEEFWKGYSAKTKVVFINHYSSSTALIFPVKEIIEKAKSLGLTTILDGAHVPGHIPLNISELDPDYYTGTLHKWMLTPKGSSFLYVKKELQNSLDPLVVSWGYESVQPGESQFLDYHEYQGTRDFSTFLVTEKAIEYLKKIDWKVRSSNCKQMVYDNYEKFCHLLNTKPICPISEEFLGQMASIPIKTNNIALLKQTLYEKYKIQIPVMPLNDKVYLRYSIHFYNSQEDLDLLYKAILDIQKNTTLIQ
jgi:isopenicillin-N epimerase